MFIYEYTNLSVCSQQDDTEEAKLNKLLSCALWIEAIKKELCLTMKGVWWPSARKRSPSPCRMLIIPTTKHHVTSDLILLTGTTH